MEDSKPDMEATQSPSAGSKGNRNRDVESSMRAGFPTQSEDQTIVFNTGVRTFAKKQMSLSQYTIVLSCINTQTKRM